MTEVKQNKLADKILSHLENRSDGKDDLDGLIISIYEKEMKSLTENIMKELAVLITKGIIVEHENHYGKRWVQLLKKNNHKARIK